MSTSFALQLADLVRVAAGEPISHLKLQKLLFYSYGALTAHATHVPVVPFEAWKHGPVCREVYARFVEFRDQPIPIPQALEVPSLECDRIVRATVSVYGLLSAWQLRNETHLEAPWKDTFQPDRVNEINDAELRAYFRTKFRSEYVEAPKNLPGAMSAALDGIPGLRARSLEELGERLA